MFILILLLVNYTKMHKDLNKTNKEVRKIVETSSGKLLLVLFLLRTERSVVCRHFKVPWLT